MINKNNRVGNGVERKFNKSELSMEKYEKEARFPDPDYSLLLMIEEYEKEGDFYSAAKLAEELGLYDTALENYKRLAERSLHLRDVAYDGISRVSLKLEARKEENKIHFEYEDLIKEKPEKRKIYEQFSFH